MEMKYSSIKINKLFYVGMSILDLSKWHMYNFHYNVMKAIFGDRVHLLYTDMDSFIYEISSAHVYEELRPHARDYFDFSNYPESHMLKNSCNKKVPGKFKDESASKCITEFVGLRSKMYSFMFNDKKDISKAEVRVAKGVQKSVIFNDLRFSTARFFCLFLWLCILHCEVLGNVVRGALGTVQGLTFYRSKDN